MTREEPGYVPYDLVGWQGKDGLLAPVHDRRYDRDRHPGDAPLGDKMDLVDTRERKTMRDDSNLPPIKGVRDAPDTHDHTMPPPTRVPVSNMLLDLSEVTEMDLELQLMKLSSSFLWTVYESRGTSHGARNAIREILQMRTRED